MDRDINIPSEKCVSDIDPSKFQLGDFTFPTINMRIINLEGKGYVCTSYPGNKSANNPGGELFSVPNATFVSGVAYNGILYLFSVKETGEGEVGCYPSPKNWSDSNTEFEDVYKPLKVWWDGSSVVDLTTEHLDLSTDYNYNLVIKLLFDGTINIYVSDYVNPSYVINTGFDQEGRYVITNHTLSEVKLKGQAQIIQGSQKPIQSELINVEKQGKLPPGNYYIYFAYQDSFYNQTRYYSILYPVTIYQGDEWTTKVGFRDKDKDTNLIYANKSIRIQLSNLDPSYHSVFVGVVRYSAVENSYPVVDAYGIDKEYIIDSDKKEIVIDGYEKKIIKSISDFSLYVNYTISKASKVFKKRNWIANLKSIEHDRDALLDFANKITVEPVFEDIGDRKLVDYIDGQASFMQFQDEKYIVDKLSHARGEIYPYAVQFLFSDGTYSHESYPIRGADMIDLHDDGSSGYSGIVNEDLPYKGLVRFPQIQSHVDYVEKVTAQRQSLGIKMNLWNAIEYKNNNPELFKNVIGYRIMRGERKKNLIYQGFIYNTTSKIGNIPGSVSSDNTINLVGSDDSSAYHIPIFGKEDAPNKMQKVFPVVWHKGHEDPKTRYRVLDALIDRKHYAMFSADFITELNKQLSNGETVYVKPIMAFDKSYFIPRINQYKNSLCKWDNTWDLFYGYNSSRSMLSRDYYNPGWFGLHLSQEWPNINPVNESAIKMKAYNVLKGMHKGPGNFTSWLGDGAKSADKGFHEKWLDHDEDQYLYNRSNQVVDYLGLVSEEGKVDLELKMVNVYKNENDIQFYESEKNKYNPRDEFYFPISDFISLDKLYKYKSFFKGDVFLQRSAFRTNRWYGDLEYDEWGTVEYSDSVDLNKDVLYYHGFLLSMMTENFNNVQARGNVIGTSPGTNNTVEYTFWPKCLKQDKRKDSYRWIVESTNINDLYEAISLNSGYSKVNPDPLYQGYSYDKLNYVTRYPTRIHYSNPQVNNELADSFRQFMPEGYSDYLNDGGIMALVEQNGHLISIQKNSINIHNVDEKQLISEQNNERILVGKSNFLSPEAYKVSSYGIHHSQAFTEGLTGVYGVHWMRSSKIIWKIISDGSSFQVIDLARSKGFKSEFSKYINSLQDPELTDNILNGQGVIVWTDKKYGEVNFSFIKQEQSLTTPIILNSDDYIYDDTVSYADGSIVFYNGTYYYSITNHNKGNTPGSGYSYWIPISLDNAISFDPLSSYNKYTVLRNDSEGIIMVLLDNYDPSSPFTKTVYKLMDFTISDPKNYMRAILLSKDFNKTFVFDEYLDASRGTNEFYPSLVIKDYDNTYINSSYDDYLKSKIFKQNIINSDYLNFNGQDMEMKISFYVLGQQSKSVLFEKIYESIEMNTSEEKIEKIEFETENQYATLAPFVDPNKYWQRPKYKLNKWFVPIPVQGSGSKGQYNASSNISGTWMKVTITYSGKNMIYLKDIITNLTIKEV